MLTSEKIDQIAVALSKAQAIMEGAKKTSTNPFFRSKYADLAEVWDTCRKPLTDNGLCVIQSISSEPPLSSDGLKEGKRYITLKVTSRLLHTSEQWFEDTISIPVEAEPQALGKVTTYIRRYALMALVGIAPEDDDGEDAAGRGNDLPEVKKVKAAQPGQEHWCAEHNCAFKEHRQGTEHWYSHKLADGKWCNEPSDTPKSSQDAQGTGDTKKAEELGGESKILK